MPSFNFQNVNQYRDYPLQEGARIGSTDVPTAWFIDIQLVTGTISEYAYQTDAQLITVTKSGSTCRAVFQADDVYFDFSFDVASPVGFTVIVNAALSPGGTTDPKYGFGFLQLGDVSAYATITGTSYAWVEPTCVQALWHHQVNSINVANKPATLVYPDPCLQEDSSSSSSSGSGLGGSPYSVDAIAAGTPFYGDVKLTGGYYTNVTLDSVSNTVTIGLADEAEESEVQPCNPLGLLVYPTGYVPPNGIDCGSLIFAINGVGPNPTTHEFTIRTSPGITVTQLSTHSLSLVIDQNVLFQPQADITVCNEIEVSPSFVVAPEEWSPLGEGHSSLEIWWDTTQIVEPVASSSGLPTFFEWPDVVGNWDLLATVGAEPKLEPDAFGDKPGVKFTGTESLSTAAGLVLDDFTVFVVFRSNGTDLLTGYDRLVDKHYPDGFIVARNDMTADAWGGDLGDLVAFNSLTLSDGDTHILCITRADTEMILYGDGTTNTLTGTCISGVTSDRAIFVGTASTGANGFKGWIGEILVYRSALSSTVIDQKFAYLGAKWDVAIS